MKLYLISLVLRIRYNLTIIFVKEGDKWCKTNGVETYLNRSFSCGKTIWLGIYEDKQLRLASLFHEVGHFLIEKCEKQTLLSDGSRTHYPCSERTLERCAWEYGERIAKRFKVTFGEKELKFKELCLNSYED